MCGGVAKDGARVFPKGANVTVDCGRHGMVTNARLWICLERPVHPFVRRIEGDPGTHPHSPPPRGFILLVSLKIPGSAPDNGGIPEIL